MSRLELFNFFTSVSLVDVPALGVFLYILVSGPCIKVMIFNCLEIVVGTC